MQYPDFKLRYSCLGQEAIKSSSDNKTAVWALMDGIPFDRERYRLGKFSSKMMLSLIYFLLRTHHGLLPCWSPWRSRGRT